MPIAGLPSRTSRWTRSTPLRARRRGSGRAADRRRRAAARSEAPRSGEARILPRPCGQARSRRPHRCARSSARVSDTPAIGRIPLSCERVQASPNLSPKAASMTAMTASMSSAVPGVDPDFVGERGRRHHAASGPGIGRAGINRLGGQGSQVFGKPQRVGRRGPGLARFAPAAGFDQLRGARSDNELRRWRMRRIGWDEIAKLRRGAERPGVELLDEEFAMPADNGGGDFAFVRAAPPRAEQARTCPQSSASQPIARPCAAAIATRMPVKLPGPTPTRIWLGVSPVHQLGDHRHQPLGMAAADQLIGRATQRRRRRTRRRCRRRSTCRKPGSRGANSGHKRLNAASPESQTASTVSTSGT